MREKAKLKMEVKEEWKEEVSWYVMRDSKTKDESEGKVKLVEV